MINILWRIIYKISENDCIFCWKLLMINDIVESMKIIIKKGGRLYKYSGGSKSYTDKCEKSRLTVSRKNDKILTS